MGRSEWEIRQLDQAHARSSDFGPISESDIRREDAQLKSTMDEQLKSGCSWPILGSLALALFLALLPVIVWRALS